VSDEQAPDTAPYLRFRPTPFYEDTYMNGTFTADIVGCNWTCAECWSKYGWRDMPGDATPKTYNPAMTPGEVADKLIAGMKRNAQPMCRISGGEATMYWEHLVGVIGEVIERTAGLRMHVDGASDPQGEVMGILIETNGGLVTPTQLAALEEQLGEEASRVVFALGMKASNPEELGRLTGMTLATCQRFHKRQMANLRWLAFKAEHLEWNATFLTEFTLHDEYVKLEREIERRAPGRSRAIGVNEYNKGAYNSSAWYTPKRFRTAGQEFNEPGAEQDEELISRIVDRDSLATEPQPAYDPDAPEGEALEGMHEMVEATAHLPAGQMREDEEA